MTYQRQQTAMTYEEAVAHTLRGNFVRRAAWPAGKYMRCATTYFPSSVVERRDGNTIHKAWMAYVAIQRTLVTVGPEADERYQPTPEDRGEDDWECYTTEVYLPLVRALMAPLLTHHLKTDEQYDRGRAYLSAQDGLGQLD